MDYRKASDYHGRTLWQCSREKGELFEEKGIWLVANSKACADADVPSMPVELNTLIQDESITSIWDVGGDMVGAKVLARYQPQVIRQDYRMLFVLNANRPQTASVEIAKNYFRDRSGDRVAHRRNNK